ncbi:hypothetical protein D3C85_1618840 [compost metagenome]
MQQLPLGHQGAARGLHERGLHLYRHTAGVGRHAAGRLGQRHIEQRHQRAAMRHAKRVQVLGTRRVMQFGLAAGTLVQREAQLGHKRNICFKTQHRIGLS